MRMRELLTVFKGQHQLAEDHAMVPEHLTPVLRKKIPAQAPQSRYWKEQASLAANFIELNHYEAHRGAILWCPTVTAIFENRVDDNADEATGPHAGWSRLRERLASDGYVELGIGVAKDGCAWCMLVRSNDAPKLFDLAWEFSPSLDPVAFKAQKEIAIGRVWTLHDNPANESC